MKMYLPLYAQIVGVFFINVALLVVIRLLLFSTELGLGWEEMILRPVIERVQIIAMVLHQRPRHEWNIALQVFEEFYDIKLYLFDTDGVQLGTKTIALPQRVRTRISEASTESLKKSAATYTINTSMTAPLFDNGATENRRYGRFARIFAHTSKPNLYWIGAVIPKSASMEKPAVLLAVSPTMLQAHLSSDIEHILPVLIGSILLSLLVWWPFVYGITSTLRKVTKVTEKIAEGKFDTLILNTDRRDELGRLSVAINRMAVQLNSFVKGQKRFLGDTAHELSSPVARLQVGFEILEKHKTPQQARIITDIREEIEEIRHLINELLAFSKAGILGKGTELSSVQLDTLLEAVVVRMCPPDSAVLHVQKELYCLGDKVLLERAFGNVLRNAVRYASESGAIEVTANHAGKDEALVVITDHGPGVPEEAIEMLGQPFYRPEPSRNRSSGGIGLGLAIVKTCIETCGGKVVIRNNKPSGLQVEIRLQLCEAPSGESGVPQLVQAQKRDSQVEVAPTDSEGRE